ncbi:hypothetical protein L13192_04588 [Pyrenophora tritici-repentis]|nr:hypothetical protein L13192_04588 [Pyrenophora tritici-repentis]KAI1684990.1 hypothetical protein KJE20_05274 [Pyrenophora tritici-repentis]
MAHNGKKSYVFATKSKPKPKPKHSKASKKEKSILQSAPLLNHDANFNKDGLIEGTVVTEASVSQTNGFPCQDELTKDTGKPDNKSTLSVTSAIIPMSQLTTTSRLTPLHSDKSITEDDSMGVSTFIAQPECFRSSALEYSDGEDILVVEEEIIAIEDLSTAQGQVADPEAFLDTMDCTSAENGCALSVVSSAGFGGSDSDIPDRVQRLVDTPESLSSTAKNPEPEGRSKSYSPRKSSRRPFMNSYQSLGPSIMFASLFGTEPISAYYTVPNYPSTHEASGTSHTVHSESLLYQDVENALNTADVTTDADSEPVGAGKLESTDFRSSDPSSEEVCVPFAGKMALLQAMATDPVLDGVVFCKDDTNPILYEQEPIPDIDPDFSDDEEDYLHTYNALVSISATSSPPVLYDKKPIPDVDPDCSDDEDYLRTCNVLASSSPPTPSPGKGVGGGFFSLGTVLRKTFISDHESGGPDTPKSDVSIAFRNSSQSSRVSDSSTDFHMNNTFLGSTSARDLLDRATSGYNGMVSRKAIAAAFVRCVADEHADMRSVSPGVDAPGVTFITENDVDQCMSFETQRRAKLGYTLLFKFLKMIEFDDAAMATDTDFLDAWRKAALESRELTKSAKNSPASRAARRISQSRSESEQSRGRPRVRPAA